MKNKIALFLGAGASRQFGYPLTKDLLPETFAKLKSDDLFEGINSAEKELSDMRELAAALKLLMPGWERKHVLDKLPLITEVLSLIDYSLAERKSLFPNYTYSDLMRIRHLLDRAIYEVLWREDEDETVDPDNHRKFCRWINRNIGKKGGVITTNYDVCIEQKLFDNLNGEIAECFDFGFSWLDTQKSNRTVHLRPKNPVLQWFKLHGSLNWARCPACEHIYINPYGKIAHQTFREEVDYDNTCHCGENAKLELHLVAPSMYRTVRDANLLEVWKNALELLITAQQWYFVGYSLPTEDIAIRSMIVRAFHAKRENPPQITVIQRSDDALDNYKLLFPDCNYLRDGLGAWLDTV